MLFSHQPTAGVIFAGRASTGLLSRPRGALAAIPPLAPLDDPDWFTLDEAGDCARVTEVSETGSVPFLKLANGADQPLPLLDGEELLPSSTASSTPPCWWPPTRR